MPMPNMWAANQMVGRPGRGLLMRRRPGRSDLRRSDRLSTEHKQKSAPASIFGGRFLPCLLSECGEARSWRERAPGKAPQMMLLIAQ